MLGGGVRGGVSMATRSVRCALQNGIAGADGGDAILGCGIHVRLLTLSGLRY